MPDTTLARVAGELYGVLLDARPFVAAFYLGERRVGTRDRHKLAGETLDRMDAALASAADYLGGDE